MIYCYGDSITEGMPGVSYCRYFSPGTRHRNFGLGGDTLYGLLERIKHGAVPLPEEGRAVVLIGTNDIMLPHLKTSSPTWKIAVKQVERRGSRPTEEPGRFGEMYGTLLDTLSLSAVTAVSIPLIGEDLHSPLNQKADQYNQIIRELCEKRKIPFLDFNARQKKIVQAHGIPAAPYFFDRSPFTPFGDKLITRYLRGADRLGAKRGLSVTIDGVHLNDRSAALLAAMIEESLVD